MSRSEHAAASVAARDRKLRVLLFSTLYPSSARPGHGIFVETRLLKLLDSGDVEAKVVAPVPWFHSTDARHGERARIALTPHAEIWNGVAVQHPRYLLPPHVGQNIAPFVLALGAWPALRRLVREGFDFDLIDAHYFYPDGVAAAMLARAFGKPLAVSARGSDLNVLGQYPLARHMMRWTLGQAQASIGVCNALADTLRGWGADPSRLHVLRNGVDLQRFRPMDRQQARDRLGLVGAPLLLSVGNLVEVKGHDLTIDALSLLVQNHPEARLVIVGDGPLRERLQSHATSCGLASKVAFVGRVANDLLADWYSAADTLVLSSRSEGWANVLLESMACGTPVVATDVGGSSEVVAEPCAGELVRQRNASEVARSVERLLACDLDRQEVRRYAERFGWDSTTAAQLKLFSRLAGTPRPAPVGLHA